MINIDKIIWLQNRLIEALDFGIGFIGVLGAERSFEGDFISIDILVLLFF